MKKKKKNSNAIKIIATDAKLPLPSSRLIEEVAKSVYMAVSMTAVIEMNTHEAAGWEDLHEEVRDIWRAGARSAYAVIAIHGGGKIEGIDAKKT